MATSKEYIVRKNGEELKTLKSLAAARKLADEQGGEVVCEGTVVYTAAVTHASEGGEAAEEKKQAKVQENPQQDSQAKPREKKGEAYTLLSRMNIRTAPSLEADKVGVAEAGTVVDVLAVENDWLRVRKGSSEVFVLFGSGKYARKS